MLTWENQKACKTDFTIRDMIKLYSTVLARCMSPKYSRVIMARIPVIKIPSVRIQETFILESLYKKLPLLSKINFSILSNFLILAVYYNNIDILFLLVTFTYHNIVSNTFDCCVCFMCFLCLCLVFECVCEKVQKCLSVFSEKPILYLQIHFFPFL